MNKENITEEKYKELFLKDPSIRKSAHSIALDVRKFEIELYWKRATYFWTFIAAALAGFGAIQASNAQMSVVNDLSVFLSCLGIVFSIGWFCVNRGSKYWQENWENHLDMLEDKECGPIYKVVLSRPKPAGKLENLEHILNGPSPISVSKINQLISLYVCMLWIFLLFYSLPPFSTDSPIKGGYVFIISLTIAVCVSFFLKIGASWQDGYIHRATLRKTIIENES